MSMNRTLLLSLVLMLSYDAIAQESSLNTRQMLSEAATLMQEGNYRLAIGNKLDPVIENFEAQFQGAEKRIYGARSQMESLYYLVEAAAILDEAAEKMKNDPAIAKMEIGDPLSITLDPESNQGSSENAIVIGQLWGDALFMKGSALISLNSKYEAEKVLAEAVKLSPMNSMYLSEYAYVFMANKDFENGLMWATKAEEAAQFSPDDLKSEELGRAKRNMGYALIELGRLDEAEKKYKEALKIDKKDQKAKNELEYIKQLRSKQDAK